MNCVALGGNLCKLRPFQEIVQNADDAGAKDVIFLLDETDYGCEKGLLSPKLDRYQVGD